MVECPTLTQSYDPYDNLCSFDPSPEWEYIGTIRECLLYISRTETPTDYVIVHPKDDDTYTLDDIVWRPFDQQSDEWLSHYLRKRKVTPEQIRRAIRS